jgi:hypothetical protein
MTVFNPFEAMNLDSDHCFLCGQEMGSEKTDEHVFPRWLLRRHDLYSQRLNLLNDTQIPYRQLKVPCCPDCNNAWLSSLETAIQFAVEAGADTVRTIPGPVFQWMLKIFYGLLYRETSLAIDRADPDKGVIVRPEVIEIYRMVHLFLQSVKLRFEFAGGRPFSLLVVPLHSYGDNRDFDYMDSPAAGVAALRTRDVGIIMVLEDCGAQQPGFTDLEVMTEGHRLTDVQFYQLFAMIRYRASLMQRVPKYTSLHIEGSNEVLVTCHPLKEPIYREWQQREYAEHLAQVLTRSFSRITLEDIFKAPDRVREFTFTEEGKFAPMDPDESPFQPAD